MDKSPDLASRAMLKKAEDLELSTIWDRFAAQTPQCGFGELGLCCRNCLQGPCRIDPFGEGSTQGACGATADTIVARNLVRAIAAGCAAHAGHAKHLAHTLLKSARGEAPDYPVRDEAKLRMTAARSTPGSSRARQKSGTWTRSCTSLAGVWLPTCHVLGQRGKG
ncbi:MAG: hypothetical protein ACOC6L_03415 [Thermodesulfobacteriota bacterium]